MTRWQLDPQTRLTVIEKATAIALGASIAGALVGLWVWRWVG